MAAHSLLACVVAVVAAAVVFQRHVVLAGPDGTQGSDVLQRLARLEQVQRENQAEVQSLREIVAQQLGTIREQDRRIKTLENQIERNTKVMKSSEERASVFARKLNKIHKAFLEQRRSLAPVRDNSVTSVEDSKTVKSDGTQIRRSGGEPTSDQGGKPSNGHLNRRQVSGGIAFTVFLGHDVNLGAHQTIKFDQVITNEGSGYSTHTGVFSVPEAGVYMFTFTVGERDENQYLRAELVVNSRNLIDAAVDTYHPSQDLQGGNTVVVRLNTGDLVWVDAAHSGIHVEGETGLRLTTFTGVYLYA